MNQKCFDYLCLLIFTAKNKKFSIQQRRTRIIHFCVIADREFKVFGDTTLIKIAKASKINLKLSQLDFERYLMLTIWLN